MDLRPTGLKRHGRVFPGTVPRLPVPRIPPGGSLGTPNILGTGATFHLGALRLHVVTWSAVPKNGQHGAKNVPCRAVPIF